METIKDKTNEGMNTFGELMEQIGTASSQMDQGEDKELKCLQLSQKFLAGKWMKRTVTDITVKRLKGGMNNIIYLCESMAKEDNHSNEERDKLVIRFYGPGLLFDNVSAKDHLLNDQITSLMASERNIGPKIYGLEVNAQIQHYYEHKRFLIEKDIGFMDALAKRLAQIHEMNVPVEKRNTIETYITEFFGNNSDIDLIFNELKCNSLTKSQLEIEIHWLFTECLQQCDSPVVFSHNDFRTPNIMVTNEPDDSPTKLIICDYECSSYNYRGYDFGTIIHCWAIEGHAFEMPPDASMEKFILAYIGECERIYGKEYSDSDSNSMQRLLREAKVFTLFSLMHITICLLDFDAHKRVGFPFGRSTALIMAENTYKDYVTQKKRLLDQLIITGSYD